MIYLFFVLSIVLSVVFCICTGSFSALSVLWKLPLAALVSFLGLLILFCLVLFIACLFVDPKKLTEKPSAFFRFMLHQFCRISFFLGGVRVHTTGLELLPKDSRFLLVSNHAFAFDPMVFYHAMPQADLSFLSKKENFDLFLVAQIMRQLLCLPVDRDNDREALKAILKAIQFLKEDKASIAVFPEGYTNRTKELLLPFRNGVFKIAQKANVPIVVCCLSNSRKILRNMFRRRTDVYLDVLEVLPAESLAGLRTNEIGDRAAAIMGAGLERHKTESL